MATSSTYDFDPTIAEFIDESFERCGIDPAAIVGRHIRSAIRSLNFLFSEWSAYLEPQVLMLDGVSDPMTTGQEFFELPVASLDILNMQLRRDGTDIAVGRITRTDYNDNSQKTSTGRSSSYFLDRSTSPARVYPYLRPIAGDVFRYTTIQKPQDAGKIGNTLEFSSWWNEAIAANLAAKIAEKYKPSRHGDKIRLAKRALVTAKTQERGEGDMRLVRGRGRR